MLSGVALRKMNYEPINLHILRAASGFFFGNGPKSILSCVIIIRIFLLHVMDGQRNREENIVTTCFFFLLKTQILNSRMQKSSLLAFIASFLRV